MVTKTEDPAKTAPDKKCKSINLALQGGGAQGAFTWGVLDQLLTDSTLTIESISGTSAGAVNGAIVAYGLIKGGREMAREMLAEFWRKVSVAASFSPLQPTPFDRFSGQSHMTYSPAFFAMDAMMRVFSPYQFNLFDLNPLRDLLESTVDFEVLRKNKTIKLFVNATNVRTGKIKIFRTEEMTLDMVMASACLPYLFKTVYVNEEPYWDGGYSGNPAIYPLIYGAHCKDVVIVQINPLYVEEVPTHAGEILDRINAISFNSNLMREMRAIAFVSRLISEGKLQDESYKNMHIHMIEAQDIMAGLDAASKFNADWEFLSHLRDVGVQAAKEWSQKHHGYINERSTIDIRKTFL